MQQGMLNQQSGAEAHTSVTSILSQFFYLFVYIST